MSDARFHPSRERSSLWSDVEILVEHTALTRALQERGLEPATSADRRPSFSSRLRRALVGLALIVGCLAGSAGGSSVYASLYQTLVGMWAERGAEGLLETNYARVGNRARLVEETRSLRSAVDPGISAEEAAEALNALQHAVPDAEEMLLPELRRPDREYTRFTLDYPDYQRVEEVAGNGAPESAEEGEGEPGPREWHERLLQRVARQPLSSEEREALERMVSHPAFRDWERLAHAGSVDLSWRYDPRYAETRTMMDLPLPSFGSLREMGYAQAIRAALLLDEGREREAEHLLRDQIAMGQLLYDHSPLLIESLTGAFMVREAVTGLRTLYDLTGREEEARSLQAAEELAERHPLFHTSRGGTPEEKVQGLLSLYENPRVPRALKWEALFMLGGMDLCHTTPEEFQPGSLARTRWEKQVAEALIRYPGERWLLDLMRRTPEELRRQEGDLAVLKACTRGGL